MEGEPGEPATAAPAPAMPGHAEADWVTDLLDQAVSSIFTTGMSLEAATRLPGDLTTQQITEAPGRLDWDVQAALNSTLDALKAAGTVMGTVVAIVAVL